LRASILRRQGSLGSPGSSSLLSTSRHREKHEILCFRHIFYISTNNIS
jgi:hypothetical protein